MEKQNDWVADIAAMHDKFGVNPIVREFDREKLQKFLEFRLMFLREELVEAFIAAGYNVKFEVQTHVEPKPADAEHVVDAMIDLCVVAIGTLNALDIDAYEAWNRVHAANMQKEPGIKASRPNPLGLPDLIKPAGWTSPTHVDNVGLLTRVFHD